MSVCLKRNGMLWILLSNSPPRLRRAILDAAPNDLIKAISEISLKHIKRRDSTGSASEDCPEEKTFPA